MSSVFYHAGIEGVGAVLPKEKSSVEDFGFGRRTKKISALTGIVNVGIAPEDTITSDYAVYLAKHLFAEMELDPQEIDGIVFVSTTPDYISPPTSVLLQHRLGLSQSCAAFDINYACPGYVYGLMQSFMMVETRVCRKVLLIAGDVATHYISTQDKAMSLVTGDAVTVSVIGRREKEALTVFEKYTDGGGYQHLFVPAGGFRTPKRHGVTDVPREDEDGNIRTDEHLYMNGMEIMRFAVEQVPIIVDQLLHTRQWAKGDVGGYYFHQANDFIVNNIDLRMNLSLEKIPIFVRDVGNTGVASIPLTLCAYNADKSGKELARSILCAFGAGLVCIGAAIDLSHTHFSKIIEM